MTNLGLAVAGVTRDGVPDSPVLLEAAAAAGLTARLIDWRSDEWAWADVVLLHAPWDYTHHVDAFAHWLKSLSTTVFNPYADLSSNLHKSYLLDLIEAGIPLPPTRLLPFGGLVDVSDLWETFGSAEVVVKPAVGAGGRGLIRLARVDALLSCPLVADQAPVEDLIVQAFVPSIEVEGEYSLVMIGGKASHLIRKTPAAGQFRVQTSYGGTEHLVELDSTAARVEELVRTRTSGLAYARVDYVVDENREPLLMELELTEPDLFLRHFPDAARGLVEYVRDNVG